MELQEVHVLDGANDNNQIEYAAIPNYCRRLTNKQYGT